VVRVRPGGISGAIAVVVTGGAVVAGGFATLPGIWGAVLFSLVTMLNTLGAGPACA